MNPALDVAVRSTLLLAAGWLVTVILVRWSAAVRHRVLTATVVTALLVPGIAPVAPRWNLPATRGVGATPPAADRTRVGMAAASVETVVAVETTVTPGHGRLSGVWLVVALWTAGSLVLLGLLFAGLLRLRRLARESMVATSGPWPDDAARIGAAMGVGRVRVLYGTRPDVLAAWGWHRPTILVPPCAAEWSVERREIVLAHELAHLTRGDWPAQLAAELVRALYWFNPLAWAIGRRLRLESECACDDHVLSQGIRASDYASHLAEIACYLHPLRRPVLPVPAMARPTSLEGRIRAMLNPRRDRRPVSRATTFTVALIAAVLTLVTAGAQPAFVPVSGTIVDHSGRVLPGVLVSLKDSASSARYEVRSDPNGHYSFAGVAPADYVLQLSLVGFENVSEPLQVTGATTHDVAMIVGTLQETITVRGAAPAANLASLADRRAKAREQFDAWAERGTAPCRASGPPAVGGNILAPRKLVDVRPVYPPEMLAAGTGGVVTLTAVIGTDGVAREIADVHGPNPALEIAAADAVRGWQFSQTFLNCEPIEVKMTVTTNFVP
jgi:beta-lactamase regulating signal transducer with metallopeptidase domain